MRILIEGQEYEKSKIEKIYGSLSQPEEEKIRVNRIGYYFNKNIRDCVVCLPKVVMFETFEEEGRKATKAFGKFSPEELVNLCTEKPVDGYLTQEEKKFVEDFALWSYRTISAYHQQNPESSIVSYSSSSKEDFNGDRTKGTLFDVIFSIIRFYHKNKDYFIYIAKNVHSGYNKLNWRKTISGKTPLLQDGVPIYMEVVNRKKVINFDEQLMIIFYSILNYISENLGIRVPIECNYEKYYQTGSGLGTESIYKQYTYAKNIVQFHFRNAVRKSDKKISYRDDLTEGYKFSPNFFISAYIPTDFNYENSEITERLNDSTIEKGMLSQFDNRLFDRDTLRLTHYDINLLYVMKLYAEMDDAAQETFKAGFRNKVFDAFQKLLQSEYELYWIKPKVGVEEFVRENFKLLIGKIYRPEGETERLLLAMERSRAAAENKDILEFLDGKIEGEPMNAFADGAQHCKSR